MLFISCNAGSDNFDRVVYGRRNRIVIMNKLFLYFLSVIVISEGSLVLNTWNFEQATAEAWKWVLRNESSVNALVAGCSVCEELQCDGTVGYGGSPDENGETTLDAMVFDGATMNMGAVAALRNIKSAMEVAKHVLKYTTHSLLAGSQATEFAKQMDFLEENLTTEKSKEIWSQWRAQDCQPNSWTNVDPDPKQSCGPYSPITENSVNYQLNENVRKDLGTDNHDTIGMIVIDNKGDIAAGTSTNGMTHKIPGRVGDSPIPGAGAYADNDVGAAAGTGDGDVMMRFLPSFLAVEEMRRGAQPHEAAQFAIDRIKAKFPTFFGAVIAVNKIGEYGAACNGMDAFKYCVASENSGGVVIKEEICKK